MFDPAQGKTKEYQSTTTKFLTKKEKLTMKPQNYPDIEKAFYATLTNLPVESYTQQFSDQELCQFLKAAAVIPEDTETPPDVLEAYVFGARLAIGAAQLLGFDAEKEEMQTALFGGEG